MVTSAPLKETEQRPCDIRKRDLQKFTQDVFLADLDKDVVDFVPNFDETEKEPEVLPVRVPNLLVNGAEGIAVGMATSIPTHNLGEVIDAVIAYMKNNDTDHKAVNEIYQGTGFPDRRYCGQSGRSAVNLRDWNR